VAIRTVSRAAADAGVSPDTLRYYERVGLLAPSERSATGYRMYDGSTTDRVRLIKGAQGLGLRLASIRDLLAMLDRGVCPCGQTRELAVQRVAEIDAEILRLTALRTDLLALAAGLGDDVTSQPMSGRRGGQQASDLRCPLRLANANGSGVGERARASSPPCRSGTPGR
jgi:DNA-binding transcriptional MerR regulator